MNSRKLYVDSVFIALVLPYLLSSVNGLGKYAKEQNAFKDRLDDDRPFRTNKINLMWEKAKKSVSQAELTSLYREFIVQDKMQMDWKKKSAEGMDQTGEEEAALRKRFHGILMQYGLQKKADNDVRPDNEVLGTPLMDEETAHFDKKLSQLWKQAQLSEFSDGELDELKTEFLHHQEKLDELDLMKRELYDIEDISANSIHRFDKDGKDTVKTKDEGHAQLKLKHKDVKKEFMNLEAMVTKDTDMAGVPFKNRKVMVLWNQAKKANFTDTELLSFQQELMHFENKLTKHEYKKQEAEMAALHRGEIPNKLNNVPQSSEEMEGVLSDSERKLKKYHTELKRKIAQKLEHSEL